MLFGFSPGCATAPVESPLSKCNVQILSRRAFLLNAVLVVSCPTSVPPKIDGKLDDTVWRKVQPTKVECPLFTDCQPLAFRFLSDKDWLYMAIEGRSPQNVLSVWPIGAVLPQQPLPSRGELQIILDEKFNGEDAFRIKLSPSLLTGASAQALKRAAEIQWPSDSPGALLASMWEGVRAAASLQKGEWRFECAISRYRLLDERRPRPEILGLRVLRSRDGREVGAWPTSGNALGGYASLLLGAPPCRIGKVDPGSAAWGDNPFHVWIENVSDTLQAVRADFEVLQGETILDASSANFLLHPYDKYRFSGRYRLHSGAGERVLRIRLSDQDSGKLFVVEKVGIKVAPPLVLRTDRPFYTTGTALAHVRVDVHVGELESDLILTLDCVNGSNDQVQRSRFRVPAPFSRMNFDVDLQRLGPGKHKLNAFLMSSESGVLAKESVLITILTPEEEKERMRHENEEGARPEVSPSHERRDSSSQAPSGPLPSGP